MARRGIQTYQAALIQAKVGDIIYHAPVEETAKGIVEGGYSTENTLRKTSKPRGKESQKKTRSNKIA
jgi:hypothetical protein